MTIAGNQEAVPLVSIIVSVYQTKDYIAQCLDSILSQSLTEIEILVSISVDNEIDISDPKEELAICKSYAEKDSRIKLIIDEPNGLSHARNLGLHQACGKYIAFVDSDDYIDHDMYKSMLEAMEKTNTDMVISGAKPVFEYRPGAGIKKNMEDWYSLHQSGVIPIEPWIFARINFNIWNKLFKKSTIDNYQFRFPENLWCEDALFLWQYLSVSKNVFFLPAECYYYRQRVSSEMGLLRSKKKYNRVFDHIHVLQIFYNFLNSHNLFTKWEYVFWDVAREFICHSMKLYTSKSFYRNKVIPESRRFLSCLPPVPLTGEYEQLHWILQKDNISRFLLYKFTGRYCYLGLFRMLPKLARIQLGIRGREVCIAIGRYDDGYYR
jgi:glycosyltransferase involved in cell wall biosynthesis